jgi:hypothetical protein
MGCKLTIGTLGLLFLGVVLSAGEVCAQTAKDLAGTWTLVSIVNEQGGNRTDPFGPNPKGILAVDANGRYVIAIARAGLPKVASNNRTTATPEENKAVVEGASPTSGPYPSMRRTRPSPSRSRLPRFPIGMEPNRSAHSPSPVTNCSGWSQPRRVAEPRQRSGNAPSRRSVLQQLTPERCRAAKALLPTLVVMSTICPQLPIVHGSLWQRQTARGMQR